MKSNIMQLCEQRGMTMQELSKKACVSTDYIMNLESGKRANPSYLVLRRLSEALECTIDNLFIKEPA